MKEERGIEGYITKRSPLRSGGNDLVESASFSSNQAAFSRRPLREGPHSLETASESSIENARTDRDLRFLVETCQMTTMCRDDLSDPNSRMRRIVLGTQSRDDGFGDSILERQGSQMNDRQAEDISLPLHARIRQTSLLCPKPACGHRRVH